MPDTVTLIMDKTKETKGTVVFNEDPDTLEQHGRERGHTFYVLKDTFKTLGEPESIEVTITPR